MRVLIAFDKFKDALPARRACETAAAALRARHPDWTLDLCPLTDGGEGFAEILATTLNGRLELAEVTGPRGRQTMAPIGLVDLVRLPAAARALLPGAPATGRAAVVGLAAASGIELVPRDQRDPWQATSLGTGELLAFAARQRPECIVLGVGGSATNDLGLGALAALGFRFFAPDGTPVHPPVPARWARISRIERAPNPLPPVYIACDVSNPLLGPRGATTIFGPQKGLQPADLPRLESEMTRLAALLGAACSADPATVETPGTGATGGLPYALMVAAGARIVPGYDLVSNWLDLPARLAAADLVITGEGRFDATSLGGKGPGSLVRAAREQGKAAHVFAGSVGVDDDAVHAITPAGLPLAEALPRTAEFLTAAIARAL